MSSNLFNEWPLWYYFANHKKNLPQYTQEFRDTTVPDQGIRVSDDRYFAPILRNTDMYDFMEDRIITADEIPNLYLVSQSALQSNKIRVPENAKIVSKGVKNPTTGRGGELIPLVGTPQDVLDIIRAIQAHAANKPITTLIEMKRRVNLEELLQQPGYKNPLITIILNSYAQTSDTLVRLQEEVADLRRQLTTRGPVSTIPNRENVIKQINRSLDAQSTGDKAINIATGIRVTSSGARYQIQEMMLTPIGSNVPRNVKIAIPNSLSMDQRQEYLKLIEEEFKAKKVESTTVSEREREQILFRPLTAVSVEQARLFDEGESFLNFMNRAKEISLYPAVDTSQISGEAPLQEEEEEGFDELQEEEEEDLENW